MKKFAILWVLIYFVNGCAPQSKPASRVSREEKIVLEKFFRNFLFYETAIFTLTDSKPVTSFQLLYHNKSEEERRERERSERIYFELNRDNSKDMIFYNNLTSEEQEKAFLIRSEDYIYNFEELWDQWEKIQFRFPLKNKFLLVKKKLPESWLKKWKEHDPDCAIFYEVLFVNIPKTALVIQEYYDLFKQVVGHDFDPLKLVLELQNESSEFWDKISGGPTYSYLWGLLYGFGKENAFYHYWKGRYMLGGIYAEEKRISDAIVRQPFRESLHPEERGAYSIAKFPIPAFVSFFENDPVVEKYKAEQKRIQKLYKGKDFVEYTLELLTDPI